MSDLISRQAAIDALHMHLMYRMGTDSNKKRLDDWINGLPSAQETHEERTETHACDLIDRQAAIVAVCKSECGIGFCGVPCPEVNALKALPSAQSKDWMERNKECILQAGIEGREIEFRIGGRLFAIREKAQ